jgi:hypothetical protein
MRELIPINNYYAIFDFFKSKLIGFFCLECFYLSLFLRSEETFVRRMLVMRGLRETLLVMCRRDGICLWKCGRLKEKKK